MSMGHILIVGGGTGGHLAPGIALAERWQEAGGTATLVISKKAVDQRMVQRYPKLTFVTAPGRGWQGGMRGRFGSAQQGLRGLWYARRLLRKKRPQAVVGFGGFLTGIFALAAQLTETPLFLHEANRVPGRAVRWFAQGAHRVYLPVGVSVKRLSPRLTKYLGVPLRREMYHLPKAKARETLALPRWERMLLVLGGSQGAASLTKWTREHLSEMFAAGLNVICLTGLQGGEGETMHGHGPSAQDCEARFIPFADNMAELLSAADVVVSRAGAGSLAEITTCLVPSVLVPYPHAADDHQQANAEYLEKRGAAVVVPSAQLNELWGETHQLITNDWLMSRMRDNLRPLAREKAAETLCDDLQRFTQQAATEAQSNAI